MQQVSIPTPGLGTSNNDDHEQCAESVRTAVDEGYRHVDTAQMYGNEEAVGEGIAAADADREDVFVATKVHPENLSYDGVLATTEESLDRLGVETVDLLYVHWPIRTFDAGGTYDAAETLRAFDELRDEGKIEHVGLSNFTIPLLREARELLDAPVVAHQVEMHPLLQQEELRADAREHDTALVAYAPMMQGEADEVPELVEVAEKHDTSAAQVSLAWLLSKDDVVPIPKATGRDHLAENYAARDLELDEEDVEKIDGIDRERRLVDPDGAAWNQ